MPNLWQTVCGKVEENDENSKSACIRETFEETGIKFENKDPWLIFNDSEFNCDVYITETNQTPQHTELTKMSKWIQIDLK